jgi:hypothetical protein
MSQVYPTLNGWVGYGDGADILLRDDVPLDADHPVVQERPELFRPAEPERRGPGRPPGAKNKPKPAADE